MTRHSPPDAAPTTDALRKSYDELPYPNRPKPFTHICRLAALGRLRGISSTSPADCSVLELGCADGENLLPMALRFENSRFLGIDLSPVQIEQGQAKADAVSAGNLKLQAADILELSDNDLDRYDYIIVHGVFSWVPPAVQDRILTICRDHLTENGLAYISYNTYPGWRGKQALREMFRYHTRAIVDPREKAQAALEFLKVLPTSEELQGPGVVYIERLREHLDQSDDAITYLVHEYLVDCNQPFYFHEFVDRIEAVGMQYVGDAFPGGTSFERLPPTAGQWASEQFKNLTEQQQYVDFMCNVMFRRSLLCRDDLSLNQEPEYDAIKSLYVTATCRRADSEGDVQRFVTDPGRSFSIDHPGLLRVLNCLTDARPASVPVTQIRELLGCETTDGEVVEMLLQLLGNTVLEFTSDPFPCTTQVAERPCTSTLVRHQSLEGVVSNSVHAPISLSDVVDRHLLHLLDGSRTIPELGRLMRDRLQPDKPIDDAQWESLIRTHLERLAKQGLLEQ